VPVRGALLALLLSSLAAEAVAQSVVTSGAPKRVAITIYRDTPPARLPPTPPPTPPPDPLDEPNLQWLGGYALVSETRTLTLPAGESTVRFEGVAGGLIPQSAIVTGFPDGIVERNRDALLLSPGTLLAHSLGRRVHLRRTGPTGTVREHEAVISSGADGAVVLRTGEGYEALRCTGVPETLIYDEVPAGLAPTPTLSVRARAQAPVTATVTLSYLATGFDWQANYIANLSADRSRIDLFAWLTLASMDETSFPDADTQAVAGSPNYQRTEPQPREGPPLSLRCWPAGTTSDIPLEALVLFNGRLAGGADSENIVVTGSRVRGENLINALPMAMVSAEEVATQEELGDLKLYRLPSPVTVAANSQKQVAMLVQPSVAVELVHRQVLSPGTQEPEPRAVPLFLVTRNRTAEGLGLPLPSGSIMLFEQGAGRPILIGHGSLGDRAVGEDVEIELEEAAGVRTQVRIVRQQPAWQDYELLVSNDQDRPIRFEAEFPGATAAFRPGRRLARRDGFPFWSTTVPANGTARFRYRLVIPREQRRPVKRDGS
jgi:hypothetical protein